MFDRRTLLASLPAAGLLGATTLRAATFTEPASLGFRHTMVFNVKPETSVGQRDAMVDALNGLAKIPGVRALMIAKISPPPTTLMDSTGQYKYALLVDFASQADYRRYQAHSLYKTVYRDSVLPYRDRMSVVDLDSPFWYVAKDAKLAARPVKYRHLVFYNFKPSVPEPLRYHINSTIMGATATQPQVLGFMMGKNMLPSTETSQFEWLCIADFASQEDRVAYEAYPLHEHITKDIFEQNYSECIVNELVL